MANKIQIRRDSALNWTNLNPILSQGELGIELNYPTSPNKLKIGDGSTPWNGIGSTVGNPTIGPSGEMPYSSDTNYIANGNSYANIASADGNLVINVGNDGYGIWTFGTEGRLTLPQGSAIDETAGVSTNITVNSHKWAFDVDGNLILPSNIASINYANGSPYGSDGAGLSIADFGEGFSLTASSKIVTNKFYSTNLTQPTQHYRLELDTNGVLHLADGSIINGATLKSVADNYAGITAGPTGKDEDSRVWVDNDGAWIGTKYNTDQKLWHFDNDGSLTLPNNGNIALGLVSRINSGGFGVTNSAEFGTDVTVSGPTIIGSKIFMGAGTAESRAIVNSDGNSLIYTGVENPGFAGMVAIDPNVTNEYAIHVGANNQIELGAVSGPNSVFTTSEYVVGLGVLNGTGNINGIFANANVSVISAGNLGWKFDNDGELYLPTGGRIGATKGGTMLDGGNGSITSLTSFYANGFYAGCVTANPDGNVQITTYPGSGSNFWQFGKDGSVTFPDNTKQTTAHRNIPQPQFNLDGGAASAIFDIDMMFVDGGGSLRRGFTETYDGNSDGSASNWSYTTILNGGEA